MGGVASVAIGIGSMIASATTAVVSAVSMVVGAIGAAVASAAAAIGAAVGSVVGAVTQTVSAISSAMSVGSASIAAAITNPIASFAGTIFEYGHVVWTAISSFTEAIHLKVIMNVHNIAYIVSNDYRGTVKKMIDRLGDLGEAIGGTREAVILAFKNAETLVKSVGAVMGRAHDLTEITWLKTLQSFLKSRERVIKGMGGGIRGMLPELENHVIKPALDALAEMQRDWFKMIEILGKTADATLEEVASLFEGIDKVRADLNKIVGDLPDFIGDTVRPWINEINQEFTHFENEVYEPFKESTLDFINILQGKQAQQKQEVEGIIDRLLRPGDLLKSIDELTKKQRIDQENKVGEIASRPMEREAGDLEEQASDTFEHLEKIRAVLEEEMPPPEWKIIERPEPVMPAGGQSKKADTWYVGDY